MPGPGALEGIALIRHVEREIVRIVDLVWPGAETARVCGVGGKHCRYRFAGLRRNDGAEFPAAEERVNDSVEVAQVTTSTSEWQFIKRAD